MTIALFADRYEIIASLGAGSAATVYEVRDRRSGALRAAKVLTPENAAKPNVLARFEDEFRVLRTLHHPHLPEVYDFGWTDDGGRFLVMELVDGVPLDEYFRANPRDIWVILYELCEALSFVHDHKLLHQDIKPANILVKRTTAFGHELPLVKLIDFGLIYKRDASAKVELVGTPDYLAPEVVRGDRSLTRAVDYYSLGATLYELLVGRPPFAGTGDVLRAHLERTPVIEDEELEWAELYPHVRALLTKDWRARLEAFEEFRRAVVSRLTGGIEELDRAYGLARADSTPMVGKDDVVAWLSEVDRALPANASQVHALEICGRRGKVRDRVVDSVCAECSIRRFHVARFGREASADFFGPSDQRSRQVERFNKAIARLQESSPVAVLLVIDGIERLSDEETSFIRYLATQRALTIDNQTPFFFVIARARATTSHPLDPYLPTDRKNIQLPAGATPPDAVDDDDLRAQVAATVSYAMLEGERSDARRRLLAYVASHPAPVPVEWAREFVGVAAGELAKDVDELALRHLLERVTVSGVEALQASVDARVVVNGLGQKKILAECHRDLAARLTSALKSPGATRSSLFDAIANHHAAIGEDRLAIVARIQAVRAAWQEQSLSSVERIAQSSLEALSKSKSDHDKAARRFLVKNWVAALWARNQHTRAKQVIDEHLVGNKEHVPASLLPKYIRGILDTDGPASSLDFINKLNQRGHSDRLRDQIRVERALVLCQFGRHDESLATLDKLGMASRLDPRDQYRIAIYRAMNLSGKGAHEQVESVLRVVSDRARKDGCVDEYVLMAAIRAQARTRRGQPRDSLRIVARTLPLVHRNELYFRMNVLYRLAAAAYQDLGQPQRAHRAQRKAIALASSLGLTQFEAMSWIRLADYERVVGNFGNAVRYLSKARTVLAKSSYEADRARLEASDMKVHLWLRSPGIHEILKGASWIEDLKDVKERGHYFMMLGSYLVDNGDWELARQNYERATSLLRRADHAESLITLIRGRMRLAHLAGPSDQSAKEARSMDGRMVRTVDSPSGQLERNVALLEHAFMKRKKWSDLGPLCTACLELCDDSTEAILRLEALALVFRAYARKGNLAEADDAFRRFFALLRTVTSNLEEPQVSGVLKRLDLARLTTEYDLIQKRNKAGASTNLVA